MGNLDMLEKSIGITFHDKALLKEAMTHSSYPRKSSALSSPQNEKLGLLGSAVIGLVTCECLLKALPQKTEGEISQIRNVLMSAKTLAVVAKELRISSFLLISRGGVPPEGTKGISESAYKALVGAIYSDQGFRVAWTFVKQTLLQSQLREILMGNLHLSPKTLLQERTQSELSILPTYKVLGVRGPKHFQNFVIGIYFGEQLVAQGEGCSKKDAETAAARIVLRERGWNA
jgi:ribonuclease-3